MKFSLHKTVVALIVMLLLIAIVTLGIILKWGGPAGTALPGWEMKWSHAAQIPASMETLNHSEGDWIPISANSQRLEAPQGTSAAWMRITLPEVLENSGVLIDQVYGREIKAFVNNVLIYSSEGSAPFKGSKMIIPLSKEQARESLYVWSSGGDERLGIEGSILSGSYIKLLALYVKQDVMDIFIGAALIFVAAVFAVCSIFMKRKLFLSGFFLVLVILSCGVMVITNSPFLPLLWSQYVTFLNHLFELSLMTLLLSSILFFEKMFERGKNGFFVKVRKGISYYTLAVFFMWFLNLCLSSRFDILIQTLNYLTEGLLVLQLLYLISLAVIYALRGQVDAIILSGGFTIFVSAVLTDLAMYYVSDGSYHIYWWKWGVVVLVISLIIMLGRGFISSHEQVVQYSHELEKFNNDLQKVSDNYG